MNKVTTCNRVVSSLDIYPSLMEMCGINMPHKTDGVSFVKLLMNPKKMDWENTAYSYFNDGITVRTIQYRLTKYFRKEEPTVELYDHKKDPYENNNIVATNPDLVKKLMKLLEKGNTGVYDKKREVN